MSYGKSRSVTSIKLLKFYTFKVINKSLTYIKNNKTGPRIEPCAAPARISTKDEQWSFKTTLFCW